MEKISKRRRFLFAWLMVMLPVLFFVLLEVGLRLVGFGDSYPLFVPLSHAPDYLVQNREVSRRYFAQQVRVPTGLHDVFRVEKDTSVVRIFVQGGSSAAGYPYYYGGSFSRMLEQRLQQTYPMRSIEVINTAVAAVNTYTLLDQADEILAQAPDAVLIYAGHNEFYGALGVASAESVGKVRWVVRLYLRLQRFRVVQGLRVVVGWVAGMFSSPVRTSASTTLMERMVGEKTIPYGSALYHRGLDQFRDNLFTLLGTYRAQDVPVLVGTLASNERTHRPFVSSLTSGVQAAAWQAAMREVAEQSEVAGALRSIDAVIALDSLSATAHYTRARILDEAGRWEEARKAYQTAKDCDQLRFRASEDMNTIIRQEVARTGAILVDTQHALAQSAENGIIGSDLMLEHLHPNLEGYFLIADAFYEVLNSEGIMGESSAYIPRSLAREEVLFTVVDSLYGAYRLQQLLGSWPFQEPGVVVHTMDTVQARGHEEEIALALFRGESSWYEATTALRTHYVQKQQWHRALQAALAMIQQYPYLPSPYADAADIMVRQGRLQEALVYFGAANDLEEAATVHFMIASIHLAHRRIEFAVDHLERAVAMEPRDERTLLQLSQAYVLQGEKDKALDTVQHLLRVAPDHSQGHTLETWLTSQSNE